MPRVKFGDWLPDFPDLDNPGAITVKNVYPSDGAYRPFRTLATYTSALTARCRGAFTARSVAGAVHLFAGDATKLYHLVGNSVTWDDVSNGTYGADEFWSFAQFGDRVIATNGIDNVQSFVMASSTDFADLGGSPPDARYVAVVGDFVVLGKLSSLPQTVRWSAFDDPTTWTPSAATQADSQNIVGNDGEITGLVGGRSYGLVFMERAVYRMTYVGPPYIFQFDVLEGAPGTRAPGSIASWKNYVFWLAEDGFYMTTGSQAVPIGKNKVDHTFLSDLQASHINRITASYDPLQACYVVAYPGSGAINGDPNKCILFHLPTGKWSLVEQAVEALFPAAQSLGFTLENLDTISGSLDALPASLDSGTYSGGATSFQAFGTDHKLGSFTGDTLEAVFDTQEAQVFPGRRAIVQSTTPLVDGGTPTVSIAGRDMQTVSPSFGPDVAINSIGRSPQRSNYRYHRARVKVPAGSTWTKAQGVDFEAVQEGRR